MEFLYQQQHNQVLTTKTIVEIDYCDDLESSEQKLGNRNVEIISFSCISKEYEKVVLGRYSNKRECRKRGPQCIDKDKGHGS